ncbi:hypothetical protein [Rhizobium sp. BK176]|uniref:hypothetical protein n=1 Tax=Rhizobium sp. BK176 TaxID=2587071 RepID=UPI002167D0F8|nr:hypothetical protein [Rhizobium sp. BK176]MCS4089074.1 hypothetical protein [Rhizobium sp. BK176]
MKISGIIPDVIKDIVVPTLAEMTPGSTAWMTANGPITRETLIEEVKASSDIGQQFCTELLRVSRDLIARKAAKEASYERATAPTPAEPTLEWLKSLSALIWEHEGHCEADDPTPLLSEEDIAYYENSGRVPSLEAVIESAEGTGDRILEIRTADGELVYNGRRAVEAEMKAFRNDWQP